MTAGPPVKVMAGKLSAGAAALLKSTWQQEDEAEEEGKGGGGRGACAGSKFVLVGDWLRW